MLKSCKKSFEKTSAYNSGRECIDTTFGRDKELESTDKFMQAAQLWNLRFDANCGSILEAAKPTIDPQVVFKTSASLIAQNVL